jgi:hypothetical protein
MQAALTPGSEKNREQFDHHFHTCQAENASPIKTDFSAILLGPAVHVKDSQHLPTAIPLL